MSDGSRTFKTRPIDSIDDFLESLVNSTNAADESIQPMGIDMILAALAMRFRCWGPEELKGKTIDLRKANKNLPLSGSALNDAHICVVNTMEPRAFQGQVLPFGARAAVMGFCRVSHALWLIGVVVFKMFSLMISILCHHLLKPDTSTWPNSCSSGLLAGRLPLKRRLTWANSKDTWCLN